MLFAVCLKKCFVEYKTSPLRQWRCVDHDWFFIFGWTYPSMLKANSHNSTLFEYNQPQCEHLDLNQHILFLFVHFWCDHCMFLCGRLWLCSQHDPPHTCSVLCDLPASVSVLPCVNRLPITPCPMHCIFTWQLKCATSLEIFLAKIWH